MKTILLAPLVTSFLVLFITSTNAVADDRRKVAISHSAGQKTLSPSGLPPDLDDPSLEIIPLSEFSDKLHDALAARAAANHIGPTQYDVNDFDAVVEFVKHCSSQIPRSKVHEWLRNRDNDSFNAYNKEYNSCGGGPLGNPVGDPVERPKRRLVVQTTPADPENNVHYTVRIFFEIDKIEDENFTSTISTLSKLNELHGKIWGVASYRFAFNGNQIDAAAKAEKEQEQALLARKEQEKQQNIAAAAKEVERTKLIQLLKISGGFNFKVQRTV